VSNVIADLLEGIASFVTDVWVLRRQRASRNRTQNPWRKDTADVALFDLRVIGVSMLALAAAALMVYLFALPLWVGLLPVAAGAVYVGYRWFALARA